MSGLVKIPRPSVLGGKTYRIDTHLGKIYVTVNWDGADTKEVPVEVFMNVGKGGSDTAAHAEAITRLISLVLQLNSSKSVEERVKEIVDELEGIGGGQGLNNSVKSLPDAAALVLANHAGLDIPRARAIFEEDKET